MYLCKFIRNYVTRRAKFKIRLSIKIVSWYGGVTKPFFSLKIKCQD